MATPEDEKDPSGHALERLREAAQEPDAAALLKAKEEGLVERERALDQRQFELNTQKDMLEDRSATADERDAKYHETLERAIAELEQRERAVTESERELADRIALALGTGQGGNPGAASPDLPPPPPPPARDPYEGRKCGCGAIGSHAYFNEDCFTHPSQRLRLVQ